jgi:pyruvate/2-oxoglutarate dehydrogenase complex dihydrolipoamide dehydrogenase (E3) component
MAELLRDRYGSKVTQLYRGDKWLRGFDNDVRDFVFEEYEKQGIDVKFNSNIAKVEKTGDGLKATLEDGTVMEADVIMYATGRVPKTKNLGLEEAGVKTDDNGAIIVDEGFQVMSARLADARVHSGFGVEGCEACAAGNSTLRGGVASTFVG